MSTFEQIPHQHTEFKGKIGETYKDSISDFPQPPKPPEGAPNILMVLVDDMGFASANCFGSLIPTPNLDKLAAGGLKYNTFHTAAMCSPTRAALLTGRNHHQSGFGIITEGAAGYPGYNTIWDDSNAAIPAVLKGNGYSTSCIGKWHNTPDWEISSMGPFDRWPTGKGFEYFYGFIGGNTDQFYPQLHRNTYPIEPKKTPEEGYHLTEDLVEEAMSWIGQKATMAPETPWFMYFAPGATHAAHQSPDEYLEKFRGMFDMGWDEYRERAFQRQKELGIVPENSLLTKRPDSIPAWDSLGEKERKVQARLMEAYAAMLNHLDDNLGKLFDFVQNMPGGDNTMIMAILGDNGCSPEGGLSGVVADMYAMNGFHETIDEMYEAIDKIGTKETTNNFSAAWAWAADAPFQWMKEVASHFGGTRNPMIVSWPEKIKDKGGLRSQFHHVIDIAPTIYELAGITAPTEVNGLEQVPLAGHSLAYTFDDKDKNIDDRTQYFEVMGNRAVYKDGWIASAVHGLPWQLTGKTADFENDHWELYDLKNDFTQAVDVADKYPEKVEEMKKLFALEAEKYNVYPLDDRFSDRIVTDRPSHVQGRTSMTCYKNATRIPEGAVISFKNRSFRVTAKIEVTSEKTEGVIMAMGGDFNGISFYIVDGEVIFLNNFFGKAMDKTSAKVDLAKGEHTLVFEFRKDDEASWGGGGKTALSHNGKQIATGKFTGTTPVRYGATETLDIGMELGSGVSPDYVHRMPFAFTGEIVSVTIDIVE